MLVSRTTVHETGNCGDFKRKDRVVVSATRPREERYHPVPLDRKNFPESAAEVEGKLALTQVAPFQK